MDTNIITGTDTGTDTGTGTVIVTLLPDKKVTTTVYLSWNDLKRLELISSHNETSVSSLIRWIIKHYLHTDGSIELLDAVDDQLRKGVDYRAYL